MRRIFMGKNYGYQARLLLVLFMGLFIWGGNFGLISASVTCKEEPSLLTQIASNDYSTPQTRAVQFLGYPLYFERGEGENETSYLTRGRGYTFYFTPREIIAILRKHGEEIQKSAILRMHFVQAKSNPILKGIDEQASKSHYLKGNDPKKWRTNVSHYAKVAYEDLYPGIQAIFYGNQQKLEYDIELAPNADPKQICLQIDGARKLLLDDEGGLNIFISDAENLLMQKPLIYQIIEGQKVYVQGNFTLLADNQVGFALDSYNSNHPLTIDPGIEYSTYLGGTGSESGNSIAVDSEGNAYVTGSTTSVDFPTTAGAYQTVLKGTQETFVTKLNPTGTALIYSTYLGGNASSGDSGNGIAVDGNGNAYVTGTTVAADFPTTTGAFQTNFGSASSMAFVTILNPQGSDLVASTLLGGIDPNDLNVGQAIAIDNNGNAYVTGNTNSLTFPTFNAFQSTLDGFNNAFVTELNPTLSAPLYSTYLGGNGTDQGNGIAVDSSGNIFVTGTTLKIGLSPNTFPTTPGAFQTTYGGGFSDAFVARFDPSLTGTSTLIYSTFLGGTKGDGGHSIAIDSSLNAYVTGSTASSNFPIISGAYQSILLGVQNAFVTKLNPTGTALIYSTYLGGNARDSGSGITIDSSNNAYITGFTDSINFPTTCDAFQRKLASTPPNSNAFFTKLNAGGTDLIYSTYLGGNGNDNGLGIALDGNGNIYITGFTESSNFPITPDAYQTSLNGTANAFITKFGFLPIIRSLSPNFGPTLGGTLVTIRGTNFLGSTNVFFGNTAAEIFSIDSNTQIRVISPPHVEGGVDVTVAGPNGTSSITPADVFTYQRVPTTLTLFASCATLGQPVTLTATLDPSIATGTVSFFEGSTLLGTAPVVLGQATLTVNGLSAGTHLIFAVYSGDPNFLSSTSDTITLVISSTEVEVFPPTDIQAFQISKPCNCKKCVNIIKWHAPSGGSPPVAYRIYRNQSLRKLIAEIPANQKLIFKDYKCKKGKQFVYYLVSVDALGNTSFPAQVVIKSKKCRLNSICIMETIKEAFPARRKEY